MTRFVAVDLSGLAMPPVVEALDYETILAQLKADLVARLAAAGIDYDVAGLESDPGIKVLEAAAYRELILRARVNTAARAIMLAYAQGGDLEHLGTYYGVARRIVTPADGTTPAVLETDDLLRRRIQLAPEAFATTGAEGAYEFHTYGVSPTIKDVAVLNPAPGHVHVLPLTDTGDGTPGMPLIEAIRARLLARDVKPLTDIITVRAPAIVTYTISATLTLAAGPDRALILAAAETAVRAYAGSRHRIGQPVPRSGIFAALHVAGVERVLLAAPAVDIEPAADGVGFATQFSVTSAP